MTIIPADQVERLVMPDAWAYHDTLSDPLDVDALLTDLNGNTRAAAAAILRYSAEMVRISEAGQATAAGAPIKSFTAVTGMKVDFGDNPRAAVSRADLWEARAARLEGEARAIRPRTPAFVSVPVEPA